MFCAESELGTPVPLLTDFKCVRKIAKSNVLSCLPLRLDGTLLQLDEFS